jgi:hypothetical protein
MMMQMIARALHVVIYVTRDMEGKRRVSEIAEVQGIDDEQGGQMKCNALFSFERNEDNPEYPTTLWRCAGWSLLMDRFQAAGIPLDQRWLSWEQ